MANDTDFDHDQIGHLLGDKLLQVPEYQRAYSWNKEHVEEYLQDLKSARDRDDAYFMGTVVFAQPSSGSGRLQIVDGQQRLATTAVFFIAIRDLLSEYGKVDQAAEVEKQYLRGYVLSAEANVERLILSPKDLPAFNELLDGRRDQVPDEHLLAGCYDACLAHLREIAPIADDYAAIMQVSAQLIERVQVLVAVASGLGEAYVIFETLNDRGADLTTADLLKNYLFSKAGEHISYFQHEWVSLEADFEKPDDLVRFIRHEYASRRGAVTLRRLYRAIQSDLERPGAVPRKYVEGLAKARVIYRALRNPDDAYWSSQDSDVRDGLLAYRRFGFESSFPTLLAAFANMNKTPASKLLVKMAKWSIRAQVDGRLGGQVAEEAFGTAAIAITDKTATTQPQVRSHLAKLIPSDGKFKEAFLNYGAVTTTRAKYLLAMIERAAAIKAGTTPTPIEWSSTSFNIEHVYPESKGSADPDLAELVHTLGNLALLEKKLNRDLGDKPLQTKKAAYAGSNLSLTSELATGVSWGRAEIEQRQVKLAELAVLAWSSQ